jgi:hypothetical protein
MTKAMREKVLANQARRQKKSNWSHPCSFSGCCCWYWCYWIRCYGIKAIRKENTEAAYCIKLRALRSTSKTKKAGGGKPGPKRGKLPGGKPGPGKKTMTAAQAAAQEAAARNKVRDEAAKKKSGSF